MTDYKILQNIDLAQNEIKEVSKIANDRQDGKDKGLLIQTRDNTSLTFKRKIGGKENFIEGKVIDGTGEEVKKSILNIKPSEVSISNEKGATNSTKSKLVLGLNSETKEHIEAISPLVDIKTGNEGYTDPHISLKKDKSILELQSKTVEIKSKGTTESSLTMDGSITGVSNDILLKDSNKNVSLNLKADGTITESANTSIKETVDKVSVALVKDTTQSITLKNEKETTPSQIEILEPNVKVSKGSDSYVNLTSSGIEEKSDTVTIKTSELTPNVVFNLEGSKKSASLTSTSGTITLESQNGAETIYEDNTITTKADTIIIKSKGYVETDETDATKYYPHIKLKSSDNENSALIESKTINIYSKDSGSNTEDTINVSGSTVNITGTTTNIKTDTLNIKSNSDKGILTLNTNTPKVIIPSWTETDINSQTIGLGDSDSETIVSGSKFTVNTGTTNITSTTTVSGTTTLKSSSQSPKNTLEVKETSTSITGSTGSQADINPETVNIGTATTTAINVGRREGGTTALKSKTTNITSPTLEVKSGDVNFNGTNQTVTFEGTSGSSLISKVPTDIKNTTFSVKREDSTKVEVFKVDTSKASPLTTTIKGTEANINPTTVNIGTDTTGATNEIKIGKNSKDTTTLQSNITKIISPTIGIGTEPSLEYSVSIGKADSNVTITGNNDLSITADKTNSKVQAKDLKFTNSLSSDNIKIYWDSALQSLVFARA